jgi:fucokinase
MQSAFKRVALASELGYRRLALAEVVSKPLPVGTTVEALSPVRLDLTGGWSDTPPYCFEEGGHVLNVAIDLDGRPPVRAIVKRLRRPKLILESRDLGRTMETTVSALKATPISPHDPFALHRLALELTGFLSGKAVGLHVITECRVPKGSGLGTSSILAATLLAALIRAAGHEPMTEDLIERTLLLEQRLSTGGGWQDQVGGIVGGVKSTITAPGIPQRPVVEQLPLSDERLDEFEKRLVVFFSGQQRLARDILRRVEGQWLARQPGAVMQKAELKQSAAALRLAFLRSDWEGIAREIDRYWRLKRGLYTGSTTPAIDVLLLEFQGQYTAASLSGAGGGGFGYFLCRDAEQAAALRQALQERSNRPGSLLSVYETHINRSGLQIAVTR